jgi:predicted XRE-type DNA-binding protein
MAEVKADRPTYAVTARRWKHGWELHIDGVGVSQSKTLLDAESMVRDYIAIVLDVPEDSFDVSVTPEIGAGIDGEILDLERADRLAEEAVGRAAKQRVHVAARLSAAGLSGREIAKVLKVTPQRVSQLLGKAARSR